MSEHKVKQVWTNGWRAPQTDAWRERGRDYFPETGLHTTSTPGELFLWRESTEYEALFLATSGNEKPDFQGKARRFFYRLRHPASFAGLATVSLATTGGLIVLTVVVQFIRHEHFHPNSVASTVAWVLSIIFIGLALALLTYIGGSYSAARRAFIERVRLQKATAVNIALYEASSRLEANQLFKLNRRQLDEYHILSVRQQNISFKAAQVASAAAFTLLAAAIVIALWPINATNTSTFPVTRVVATGISGLGSALSGFIASTFYRSFKDTTKALKEYYWEPFNTSRLLGIERLVERAGDTRFSAPGLYKDMLDYLYTQPLFIQSNGEHSDTPNGRRKSDPKQPETAVTPPI